MPRLFLLLAASAVAPRAVSADLSEADGARIRAGIVIATFDELASRCAKGGALSDTQRVEVERWTSGHEVDRVRAHLNGAGLSAELRQQMRGAANQIIQQVASATEPCAAAVGLTRTADAKFADKLPVLLAGSTAMPASGPASGPAGAPPPRPAALPAAAAVATTAGPPSPRGDAARIAADIEGFGFDSCTRVGYGGMVMFVPCPVVLFRNGGALFHPDGTMQRDGGAGSSTSGAGASVTTSSQAAPRTGRYRVDGLVLSIDYDDGTKERRIIIADPKDQGRGTMWLDGEGYVYKK